ncbi:HEAT repeat domain-containing protein [Fortiea contorta]|uniref:HEAT repeat domain-containing protein n=1 Tax=Fortiea contorta TaxID=1892405 RepID=UPI00034497BE|nr:HEAT repeat domain-containing protein [Fortiea contorta]
MDNSRLTQIESLLRSGAINERKAALDQLAQCPADLAIPILQRLSVDPDFLCRRFAVMGLGNHPTPASLQILKDLLQREPDDNVLAEIANSLFSFGDESVPLLQQLFERHRHWLTRQTIISILMEANQDDVLLAVIRQGLQDETQTVKETSILALGSLLNGTLQQQALDLLTELAEETNWRSRWRAATALSLSQDSRAKALLAKLQQDENHYVVAAALEAGLENK